MLLTISFDSFLSIDTRDIIGAIGRSVDKDGNLMCPVCKDPPIAYDLHAVANCGGPKHVFDALFQLRANAMTSRAVEEGLANQEQRLREEFARIQAIQVPHANDYPLLTTLQYYWHSIT